MLPNSSSEIALDEAKDTSLLATTSCSGPQENLAVPWLGLPSVHLMAISDHLA